MQHPTLRDKLFAFAALARSPDPAALVQEARDVIRKHPLSSLFGSSHHDREGKVVHRSEGAGFGDGDDGSAIERQLAQMLDRNRRCPAERSGADQFRGYCSPPKAGRWPSLRRLVH